jgi:transcriptional regulator with XRE-family HTH domain
VQELRRIRKERGLTQRGLADASGVDPATISLIETGKRRPHLETLDSLALVLGVEVIEFFPKVQASLWPEERPERRFAWMAGVLERVLDTWERQVREKKNHYQSRTIAVAALDVQDTVTFNYKPEWDALPSEEKTQRHALAKRIDQLVLDAFDHYKQAKKAETEEVEAIQRRREEIRRRTREISA